ncbi:hypothetical protein B0H14DRAFT_2580128 [Mycena olivaceomarginata]|nr:hypothetical protein B0H14DRAFT_2580128 [Mycena olivaceomarginata]
MNLEKFQGPAAKEWYDTRVNGIQRPQKNWTHLQMILGLFDQFIDTACVQNATEQFWRAKYSPEIGVTGFYNELVTCANRMVRRPDSYTFKNQLMGRLPADMVKFLIRRNVTAEYCSIKEILRCAVNYEWQNSVEKRYAAARERDQGAPMRTSTTAAKPRVEPVETRDPVRGVRREDLKRKVMRYVKRDTERSPGGANHTKPQSAGYDGGGKRSNAVPVTSGSGPSKTISCYKCGGPHYKSGQRRGTTSAPSEQMREAHEEDIDEVSAYTSEGGYTLQAFNDSGSESDEEQEGDAEMRPQSRQSKHHGLFGTCDEWPAEEFVDNNDMDELAKEMAQHIIWQQNTTEVEDFLFAVGDRNVLSTRESTHIYFCDDPARRGRDQNGPRKRISV